MKVIVFAALLAYASCKEFSVKTGNTTCVLLTVDGTVDLTATNGGKTLDSKKIDLATAKVLSDSDCTTIKLDLGASVQLWFQQDGTSAPFQVTPVSTFDPKTIFAGKVNETGSPVYKAASLGPYKASESFACFASTEHQFELTTNATENNYTVTATTTQFQVQFGDITNDTFSAGPHCSADTTSTQAPTTTPTPTTTAPPTVHTVSYNVTEGNVTCIGLTSGFSMSVTYLAGKENKTFAAVVPQSATSSGKCHPSANSSYIDISFDAGTKGDPWVLKYTFTTTDTGTIDNYYVSQVDLTYSALPDATSPAAQTATYTAGSDYLKATTSGYYLCNAQQTLTTDNGKVALSSQDFKYKAFNDKESLDFSGDVAECTADDETSSVVPIAVGAALAGLVVIVLVAYLIGRRRSRKTGYESV